VVVIESRIVAVRKSSFDVEHRLTNGGELAAEGFKTRVWTRRDPNDPERIKSHPIPCPRPPQSGPGFVSFAYQ
jgi:4-hydroxybenzoyl-CoA thioesterase